MKKNQNKNWLKWAQAWFAQGDDDLLFAADVFREGKYFSNVCFYSQQSVEKYLKGLLVLFKGEITKKEKIHNLTSLARICEKYSQLNFKNYKEELRKLTEVYMPTRYPDEGYNIEYSKIDAQECLSTAQVVIKFIGNFLSNMINNKVIS